MGCVDGRQIRDVAANLGFRETLGRVLSSQVTATAVPTVVVVFPSDRAFKPFMPKFEGRTVEVGGLFVPGQDVNYIGVNSSGGARGPPALRDLRGACRSAARPVGTEIL